jgi:ABC-type transport system substrate-binding protein
VYLQTRLREVGINLSVQEDSGSDFATAFSNLKVDAWMRTLLWYVDDPGYIGSYIGSSTTCCFKTGFVSPQLDSLIEQLQSLTNSPEDAAQKKQLASQYQQMYNGGAPIMLFGDLKYQLAIRANIQGYHKDADDQLWYYPLSRS